MINPETVLTLETRAGVRRGHEEDQDGSGRYWGESERSDEVEDEDKEDDSSVSSRELDEYEALYEDNEDWVRCCTDIPPPF